MVRGGDEIERYGAYCERLGNARDTAGFRACVETQALNAAVAGAQRHYERQLIRRTDCVDPRFACDMPMR